MTLQHIERIHTWCFYIFLQNKFITEEEMEVRKIKDFKSNGVVLSYPQMVVKQNIGRKWGLEAICKALGESYQFAYYSIIE